MDYRNVLTMVQVRTIENVTQERYGPASKSVVRLLLERGALDEKHISDLIMMPQKDIRAAVLSLAADGVVETQEVPRRPDHHPQFTAYLYRARFDRILRSYTEASHQAVLNLRRRVRMETARFNAAAAANETGNLRLPEPVRAALLAMHEDREEGMGMGMDDPALQSAALDMMETGITRLRTGIVRLDACTLLLIRDLHYAPSEAVTGEDVDRLAMAAKKR